MIRINLLPYAKRSQSGGGGVHVWIAAYAAAAALWIGVLAALYYVKSGELEEKQAANKALQNEISRVLAKSADMDDVRNRLDRSHKLEKVVAQLQEARFGPTRVLTELAKILSNGGGPTIDEQALAELRRTNPLAGFNTNWDVRRLWITDFEEENRECRMLGQGRTNEDVAEFLRRLAVSQTFEEVTLEKTEAIKEAGNEVPMIRFELTSKVKY